MFFKEQIYSFTKIPLLHQLVAVVVSATSVITSINLSLRRLEEKATKFGSFTLLKTTVGILLSVLMVIFNPKTLGILFAILFSIFIAYLVTFKLEPMFRRKRVFFYKGKYIPKLEEELLMFPRAKHDDGSDALAYQFQLVKERQGDVMSIHQEISMLSPIAW